MAEILFPTSDNARSQFLKKCISADASVKSEEGTPVLIPQNLLDKGNELLPLFDEKLSSVNSLLSQRSKEVSEKQAALTVLSTWLRDLWEVLRRRTARLNHPAQVLTYYQLPLDGITPRLSKEKDMLEIARRVIDGDAAAVAKGFPAMMNPSVAELQEVLDKAWKEVNDVPAADESYDKAQEAIAEIRDEVDELIRDIYDTLNFMLRKKEAAGRRRILQNYGFRFRYLKGEPIDELEGADISDSN
ncbi:hypothetical protein KDU71_20120 [Carboxylicivirga sediminis]|uniref:Uncharacterized protein n=1 Tax=Carboxylicivirga sediminis TaxID=2006564 RepID=A0A941FAA1_9BACT|nr:hypothetical protein [Carboxylicivirga sediminis]MBR8537889.1 hypothetical protein [Carboxylicivirga sediminis]